DQRARGRTTTFLALIERVVQLSESLQTVGEHFLIGAISRVGAIEQWHVTSLADQDPQPDHPEVTALALGVAAPRQLSLRGRCDMRVEIRGVERQHVGGKLEAPDRSLRERNLRRFQLLFGHLLGNAIERLARELRGRQTRRSWQAIRKKLRE